jgi:hypothetical protein
MAKVYNINNLLQKMGHGGGKGPTNSGGQPPYDGEMDARLKALETALPTLATKVDVAELRADFAELKSDVKTSVDGGRTSLEALRVEIHKTDSAHKTWVMTTVFAVIGSAVALAGFLTATLRQPVASVQAPAAASQPIIINVPPAPAAVVSPPPATSQRP